MAAGAQPRSRTVAFTLAAVTVTFLFGLAFALGLGDLVLSVLPKAGPAVKYALIISAGAVLTLGGTALWIRRKALTRSQLSRDAARSHGSPIGLGTGIAGLELLTAFPYFAAIGLIVGSGVSNAEKVSLLLLYCCVYALPLIVIAALFVVMGKRAEQILKPASGWLFAHWPVVIEPLTAAIGVGLLAYGIVQLAST